MDGLACQNMFEALLAWEWLDPELGGVHFLTVSSYLLQHPASLADDALLAIRAALVAVQDGHSTVDQVRERHSRQFAGAQRVRRPPGEIQPQVRAWSITIADVYTAGQQGAAARVKNWARSIAAEIATDPA